MTEYNEHTLRHTLPLLSNWNTAGNFCSIPISSCDLTMASKYSSKMKKYFLSEYCRFIYYVITIMLITFIELSFSLYWSIRPSFNVIITATLLSYSTNSPNNIATQDFPLPGANWKYIVLLLKHFRYAA